jgi:hypothetical protein
MMNMLAAVALGVAGTLYVETFGTGLPPGPWLTRAVGEPGPSVPLSPEPALPAGPGTFVQGEEGAVETPSATPTPTGKVVNGRLQPEPVDPPQSGSGRYDVVPGTQQPAKGTDGPVVKYIVEVEHGMPFDPEDFAEKVHTVLNDPRSWGHGGRMRFERVDTGSVRIRVSLSSARLTDKECYPLKTFGRVSCWNGVRAVINAERWGLGAATYGDDILSYREYVINHEVGHGLGHEHEPCPRAGALAPVMVQQTKSLDGCKANPWPYP